MIEDRRFLVWSGVYFLVVVALGYSIVLFDIPTTREAANDSPLYLIVVLPACVLAIYTTFSAMWHMIVHKNYGWLIVTFVLVYVSAYLYGFFVATKHDTDTV